MIVLISYWPVFLVAALVWLVLLFYLFRSIWNKAKREQIRYSNFKLVFLLFSVISTPITVGLTKFAFWQILGSSLPESLDWLNLPLMGISLLALLFSPIIAVVLSYLSSKMLFKMGLFQD